MTQTLSYILDREEEAIMQSLEQSEWNTNDNPSLKNDIRISAQESSQKKPITLRLQ